MTNVNSVQGANRFQLEPLDAIKPRNNQPAPTTDIQNQNNNGLQSLDSLNANNYSDPNNNIPRSDILAPLDAINPEIPGMDRQDTREQGLAGFIGGVFKGFGKAGLDTVKGVATLGKLVVSAVSHPKEALNYVGGGVRYAINNPLKTAKTLAVDLPIGIVKGIIDPYATAVKTGKYGEAVGRGVFDVGIILLTAGIGDKTNGATKGAGAIENVANNADLLDDVASTGTTVITRGVEGGIRVGKDAIKVGNVTGNLIINIGNTTANVSTAATRATQVAETLAGVEKVSRGGRAAVATTEAISKAGKLSLGLGDLGSTLGRGASKFGSLFKPIGTGAANALTAIVGPKSAAVIGQGVATLGKGISIGTGYVKAGVVIAKAHPVASALIVGKAVDIVDKGLKSSDNYDPGNIDP